MGRNVVSTTATCTRTATARRDRRIELCTHHARVTSPRHHTRGAGPTRAYGNPDKRATSASTRRGRLDARHTSSRRRRQRRARPSKPCLPSPPSLPPSRHACARPAPAGRAAGPARNTHVLRSGGARREQTNIRRSTVFPAARSGRRKYVATRRAGAQTHVANLSTLPHGASEPPGSKPGHPGAETDTDSTVRSCTTHCMAYSTHSLLRELVGRVCLRFDRWLVGESRERRAGCIAMPRSTSE